MRFFHLHGSDGERLYVDRASGVIGYRAMAGFAEGAAAELVGIHTGPGAGSALLCGNFDTAAPLSEFVSDNIGVVAVQLRPKEGGGTLVMKPDHHHYVTAVPLVSMVHARPVYSHTSKADGWECFTTEEAPEAQLRAFPRAVADIAECLGAIAATTVIDLLAEGRTPAERAYAIAAIPLLSCQEMAAFCEALLRKPACLRALQEASPGNPWAWETLPELIHWHGQRGAAPPPSRAKLTATLSQSYLANAGYFGQFTSLAHACNSYARAGVAPGRQICILATARNEGVYFLEWIAYHRAIGVEHFFIYTNDNEDGSDILLAALAENGIITWVRNEVARGGIAQAKAYGHALSTLPEILDYRWVLITDLDEFFVVNPDLFDSLGDFLRWHDRQEVDVIAVNWTFVGSTSQTRWSDTPLSRRNTKLLSQHQVGPGWRLVKSLARTSRVIHSEPHFPRTDDRRCLVRRQANGAPQSYLHPPNGVRQLPAFTDEVDSSYATIYHYIYKSAEEALWRNTRNRGDQDMVLNESAIRQISDADCSAFLVQEQATDLPFDTRIQTCCDKQDAEILALRALPGVERAYQAMLLRFHARLAEVRESYRARLASDEVAPAMRQLLEWAGL